MVDSYKFVYVYGLFKRQREARQEWKSLKRGSCCYLRRCLSLTHRLDWFYLFFFFQTYFWRELSIVIKKKMKKNSKLIHSRPIPIYLTIESKMLQQQQPRTEIGENVKYWWSIYIWVKLNNNNETRVQMNSRYRLRRLLAISKKVRSEIGYNSNNIFLGCGQACVHTDALFSLRIST